ncbi:MAG: tRNA (adenosine(37)-N6)-threonylcarbamoyltransferase complex dimerization subunit type 1 TsaB [Oscillospiraceae bacterium]|jgi:tRNA threonylcarbamoyladenosine biosynthesis protein TsaB|nr:tRNA (adenosine(37)-N6)-threonylcarbamoyltransferase complex dimerization subunit type 1 TsaB [Oscillospiraceae bacterium]
MLILGLDSSAKAASAAIYDTDSQNIITYGGVNAKITHSETLMPLAETILKAAKLTLNDIDAFAVTGGPGSFTGVRIAVSAVKGMAFALDKPVYPVSALHGLAYNLLGRECIACCVMDARREQFYNALFRVESEKITRLTKDRAIDKSELESELLNYEDEIIVTIGDGAELFCKELCAPIMQREQNAVSVCLAALEYTPVTAKELMPLYLRLPQAERERKDAQCAFAKGEGTS